MPLKKIFKKITGLGDHDAEVNDFLSSVKSMAPKDDEKNLEGRRGRGTKSYGEGDLIKIGNRLAQKLHAAGDDRNLRKVSNAVFMLGKRRRR